MNSKMFASAFAALTIVLATPTVAHAGCDGLSGKELKKCEKKAAAQAKADARTTPFEPSNLDAVFSHLDGDSNPFATDDYRVRVGAVEIQAIDDFLMSVGKVEATVVMTRYTIDQVAAGDTAAIKTLPKLKELLEALPGDVDALKAEGQALPDRLQSELTGAELLKLPKSLTAVSDGVQSAVNAGSQSAEVLKSLLNLMADPKAAAGAAGDMAMDAAKEAAEGAVEDATEAAEDAAEGATEGAREMVEKATDGE